jgi:hypothetical protein
LSRRRFTLPLIVFAVVRACQFHGLAGLGSDGNGLRLGTYRC